MPAGKDEGWHRQSAGEFAETRTDGLHLKSAQRGQHGGGQHADQHRGPAGQETLHQTDRDHGEGADADGGRIDLSGVFDAAGQLADEAGGHGSEAEPEQVVELGREDHHRDSRGEAGGDGERDEFDQRPHPERPE